MTWSGVMLLWMAVFWLGAVALGAWLAGLLFPRVRAGFRPSPRDILNARYARGKLTRDQFEELRRELS